MERHLFGADGVRVVRGKDCDPNEPKQARYERVWKNVKTIFNPQRGDGPCQECERMEFLKGEKEGSPGRNVNGFGKSLRWEVS